MSATVSSLSNLTCIFGLVLVFPPTRAGVLNGTITPLFSTPIPITQVVSAGVPSIALVNGLFALLCGRLEDSPSGCRLNVTHVFPFSLFSSVAGSTITATLNALLGPQVPATTLPAFTPPLSTSVPGFPPGI